MTILLFSHGTEPEAVWTMKPIFFRKTINGPSRSPM